MHNRENIPAFITTNLKNSNKNPQDNIIIKNDITMNQNYIKNSTIINHSLFKFENDVKSSTYIDNIKNQKLEESQFILKDKETENIKSINKLCDLLKQNNYISDNYFRFFTGYIKILWKNFETIKLNEANVNSLITNLDKYLKKKKHSQKQVIWQHLSYLCFLRY